MAVHVLDPQPEMGTWSLATVRMKAEVADERPLEGDP